ncbi:hypothetical protein [Sanguibacter inulinus]|uniref:Uncharacterized protein n=1 Tax=Sanguibacter inulinus TaxID=60922 RepID=A0A853EU58_9MICO|nr:hypothetical protein [Sanguibacter inulinus]MBF0722912.1 hypothetical protein [Sanguibacter inulinus]NYS94057.1 hypothetical protein [Sanguibacter inulinus]
MGSPAGIVVVAVVVLWLAYLVPQRLRHRQQLLESRVDDRFSGRLRVLAVASGDSSPSKSTTGRSAQAVSQKHGDCTTSSSVDVSLLTPPIGTTVRARRQITDGVQDMERNDSYGSASRDALLARRAAAARRRATLTLGLVVLTALVGVIVAVTSLPVWTVAVPAVLLVSVLVLGRRAVLANARADAAAREREAAREAARPAALRRAGRPAPAVRTTVTGRAVHSSQTQTEMISRVRAAGAAGVAGQGAESSTTAKTTAAKTAAATSGAEAERTVAPTAAARTAETAEPEASSASRPTGGADRASSAAPAARQPAPAQEGESTDWEPVAVPRPVYTLKSTAPRWEPAPLTAELRKLTEERRAELAGASPAQPAPATVTAEEPSEDSLGVNLNSVLARRRAAGE